MKNQDFSKRAKFVALINLITQSGIIVTGAIVRLTGSGLGCPTWPNCAPGSLVPVASQVEGFHKFIEFGNRLLTFVVLIAALATFIVSIYTKNKKIIIFSSLPTLGTILQAILGGITVLTGLNPITVMLHFLLSIILISISVLIYFFWSKQAKYSVGQIFKNYISFLTIIGFLVIILGTITTGSGPHSGDEIASRFDIDTRLMAWIHADTVLLFLGLVIGLFLATWTNNKLYFLKNNVTVLLAICILQGFVGYSQWFLKLPWLLVAFHVLGAVLTWNALMFIFVKSVYSLQKSSK